MEEAVNTIRVTINEELSALDIRNRIRVYHDTQEAWGHVTAPLTRPGSRIVRGNIGVTDSVRCALDKPHFLFSIYAYNGFDPTPIVDACRKAFGVVDVEVKQ